MNVRQVLFGNPVCSTLEARLHVNDLIGGSVYVEFGIVKVQDKYENGLSASEIQAPHSIRFSSLS